MDKLAEINHGAKVVLGASILFLIISFFNWQEVDLGAFGEVGVSMWNGVGWIAGLLAIAIIVWQAIRLSNLNLEIGVGPAMVTAFLALLLLLFTVIKFFADSEVRTWAAWVGLILAIAVAGGAWANMKLTGESIADLQKLRRYGCSRRRSLWWRWVERSVLDAHRHDAAPAAGASAFVWRRHSRLVASLRSWASPAEEGPAAA